MRCTGWRVLALLIAALIGTQPLPADELPRWELRPYRVHAGVSWDPLSAWTSADVSALDEELTALVHRTIGAGWQWHIESAGAAHEPTADSLPSATDSSAADVWFRIWLTGSEGQPGWQLQAWQPAIQSVSPVISGTTRDARTVPERLLKDLRHLFRPVALVAGAEEDQVRLELQAGELPPADPDEPWVREGELLEIALTAAAQGSAPAQRRVIPWTLVEVTSVEQGGALGQVHSGLRQSLAMRTRSRVQLQASIVRAWYPATQLSVRTYAPSAHPLAGARVTVGETRLDEHPLERLTNRRGELTLDRETASLQWVTIWSGQQRLARVAIAPGAQENLLLEVPDDSVRVTVEGQLQILQDKLVDAVAARQALMISLRKLAKREQWDVVEEGRRRLDQMPGPARLLQDLTGVRVPAVQAARERKDRPTEVRVNRLCDETAEMIRDYLAEDKVKIFREELAELERVSKAAAISSDNSRPQ